MKYKDEFEFDKKMTLIVVAVAFILAFFGDFIYELIFN